MDKDTEINRNNKLVAKFMGLKCVRIPPDGEFGEEWQWLPYPEHSTWMFQDAPPYDHSWNWLMPVVLKIDSLGYDVDINSGLRRVNIWTTDTGYMKKVPVYEHEFRGNKSLHKDLTPIECVWSACVEFIQWYNENGKKTTDKIGLKSNNV